MEFGTPGKLHFSKEMREAGTRQDAARFDSSLNGNSKPRFSFDVGPHFKQNIGTEGRPSAVHQAMHRLSKARYVAPTLHAILFLATWLAYTVSSQPLMDGITALPFFALFVADMPISIVAFGVLFTSSKYAALAVILWGLIGTVWWHLLGRFIDSRLACSRERLDPGMASAPGGSTVLGSTKRPMAGAWIAAGFATLAIAFAAFAWGQNAWERSNNGGAIGGMTLSPDGQYLVLSRSQNGSTHLYKVALESGSSTRLTSASAGFETSPSYSPDGKQIAFAFTAQRGQPSRIFVMGADGSNPHPLYTTKADGNDFFPRFAPDGTVYFARSSFFGHYSPIARPSLHEWDIYSVNPEDGQLRQITNKRFYRVSEPSLSRDGKKMLFSVETETGSQLQLYSLDSQAPPSILQPHVPHEPSSPIYAGAALAPDGQTVIFMAASQGARAFDYDVYRVDLASNAVEKLTTANGYSTNLCVSSDGSRAVFLRWSSKYGGTPTVSTVYLLDLLSKRLSALPITGTR